MLLNLKVSLIALTLAHCFATPLVAQPAIGSCRMMQAPGEITKASGLVKAIEVRTLCGDSRPLQMLILATSVEPKVRKQIVVAPEEFLQRQKVMFVVGDKISVSGFSIQVGVDSFIAATSLTYKGKTIALRDSLGRPLWRRSNLGQTNKGVSR